MVEQQCLEGSTPSLSAMKPPLKRPKGRQPFPVGLRKDGRLSIRLSASEQAALIRAAGGVDVSTWARFVLLRVAAAAEE